MHSSFAIFNICRSIIFLLIWHTELIIMNNNNEKMKKNKKILINRSDIGWHGIILLATIKYSDLSIAIFFY